MHAIDRSCSAALKLSRHVLGDTAAVPYPVVVLNESLTEPAAAACATCIATGMVLCHNALSEALLGAEYHLHHTTSAVSAA